MAKGSGGTKGAGASSASAARTNGGNTLGGGNGIAASNSFSATAKISSFEGSASLDGGYYSLMTKDGKYSMVIETENGYNEEMGANGTTIFVGIQKGTGKIERLTSSFVDVGSTYRESMGLKFSNNEADVARRINNSMPYYAELANKWIKRNR